MIKETTIGQIGEILQIAHEKTMYDTLHPVIRKLDMKLVWADKPKVQLTEIPAFSVPGSANSMNKVNYVNNAESCVTLPKRGSVPQTDGPIRSSKEFLSEFISQPQKMENLRFSQAPTLEAFQPDSKPVLGLRKSPGTVSQPNLNFPNRQDRISCVKDRLDQITSVFVSRQEESTQKRNSKFGSRLATIFKAHFRQDWEVFKREVSLELTLLREEHARHQAQKLALQDKEELLKEVVPFFCQVTEKYFDKFRALRGLKELQDNAKCQLIQDFTEFNSKKRVFEGLKLNAIENIQNREKKRLLEFLIRLDTFLTLIKYEAFYKIYSTEEAEINQEGQDYY